MSDHQIPLDGEELRFEPVGRYRAGEQEIEIPLGTELIAIVPSLRAGWIRWRPGFEGEIASDMRWGLIGDRKQLGDLDPACRKYSDQGWVPFNTMLLLKCKSGTALTFIATTSAELQAIGRLSSLYGDAICVDKSLLPIVALRTRSEKRGMLRIHRPHFEIVDWTRPPRGGRSRRKSPTPKTPSLLNLE